MTKLHALAPHDLLLLPPGMLALSAGLALSTGMEGSGEGRPDDYEDLGEGPFNNHDDVVAFRDNELHPDLARTARLHADPRGQWHILVSRNLRRRITGMSQLPIVTWGKTRRKTAEWFSNQRADRHLSGLPTGMLALAGTHRVSPSVLAARESLKAARASRRRSTR